MNFSEKFWFDVAQWLCTIALAITVWLRKPGTDAGLAVLALKADVDTRLNAYAQRLTEIEAHMKHMATSEKLMELEGSVKQLNERTVGIDERLKTMREVLARIETYLLNNKP